MAYKSLLPKNAAITIGKRVKYMKKKFKIAMCIILILGAFSPFSIQAKEKDDLTPMEIDEILKDVPPVEISPGVYLRDNGILSIVDIDASQFQISSTSIPSPEDGEIVTDNLTNIVSLADGVWDLSTPYIASFKAEYRVFTRQGFSGSNGTIYARFYDVNCPSNSQWKSALYVGWDEIASSGWLSSGTTTYTSKFYNLDANKIYNIAFVKTDNGSEATGNIEVYK